MLNSLAFSLMAATVEAEGVAAGVALIGAPLVRFKGIILPFSLPLRESVLVPASARSRTKDDLIFPRSAHRVPCDTRREKTHGRHLSHRKRQSAYRRSEPRHASALGASRYARIDGNEIRLRHGPLRRVHRSRGRRGHSLLHHANFRGRWPQHHHD